MVLAVSCFRGHPESDNDDPDTEEDNGPFGPGPYDDDSTSDDDAIDDDDVTDDDDDATDDDDTTDDDDDTTDDDDDVTDDDTTDDDDSTEVDCQALVDKIYDECQKELRDGWGNRPDKTEALEQCDSGGLFWPCAEGCMDDNADCDDFVNCVNDTCGGPYRIV